MMEISDENWEKFRKQYFDEHHVELIDKAHSMAVSDDLQSKFAALELLNVLRPYEKDTCDRIIKETKAELNAEIKKNHD